MDVLMDRLLEVDLGFQRFLTRLSCAKNIEFGLVKEIKLLEIEWGRAYDYVQKLDTAQKEIFDVGTQTPCWGSEELVGRLWEDVADEEVLGLDRDMSGKSNGMIDSGIQKDVNKSDRGTQTPSWGLEDLKDHLRNGVKEEVVFELLSGGGPTEVFTSVKLASDDDVTGDAGNLLQVLDLAGVPPNFLARVHVRAPAVERGYGFGSLQKGQIYEEVPETKVFDKDEVILETIKVNTLIVDSRGESTILSGVVDEFHKVLQRLHSQNGESVQIIVADDSLGRLLWRAAEYQYRRIGGVATILLEKVAPTCCVKVPQAPVTPLTTVTVKAHGKTYAELPRGVKEAVNTERMEVLSLKEGTKDELCLRVGGDVKVDNLKESIKRNIGDAWVAEYGRRERQIAFHLKGLEADATEQEVQYGVSEVVDHESLGYRLCVLPMVRHKT